MYLKLNRNFSITVLEIYICANPSKLLKILYAYGFAKDRSQLCAISVKLLAFIVYCQKKTLTTVRIKFEQNLLYRCSIFDLPRFQSFSDFLFSVQETIDSPHKELGRPVNVREDVTVLFDQRDAISA